MARSWIYFLFILSLPALAGDLTQRILSGAPPPPPVIPGEDTPSPDLPRERAVSRDFTPEELGLDETGARRYRSAVEAYFFRDYARAARLWRPLAEAGHVRSQARLGWLLHMGLGVEQDPAAARRWYQRAAEGGDTVAQNNLAALLEHGLGGPRDEAAARRWYRRAAEGGYPPAQFNLAVMLAEGRGGPPDLPQARQWWQRAARAGLDQARERLHEQNGKSPPWMVQSPPSSSGSAVRSPGMR